ncbi:hypothetical protein PFISCL1PPCAC_9347 [Pristionchus fissidentatus]|uniref:RING-type domain-containing protein n=1 Tax=Pristionchus fissidentatus TaxID=1538716 RepID=A0AAV5VEE1_9BILA|nr:hypothetical protein PFISCL1PPCAC_9347 [Pristionchus fissidentatus]
MAELIVEMISRLHSISTSRLANVVDEWHCSREKCEGAKREDGGFGLHADDDTFSMPYALPCGHYLCGNCKSDLSKNLLLSHHCDYKAKGSTIKCGEEISLCEMRTLPIAHHIKKLMPFFREKGINCDFCSAREAGKSREGDGRIVRVRYPADLMYTYYNKNEAERFSIPREFDPDRGTTQVCRTNDSEDTFLLCKQCVHRCDLKELNFYDFLPLHDYDRWSSRARSTWNSWGIRDVGILRDEARNTLSGQKIEDQKPWHLWTLSAPHMTEFLDEMLACPCKKAYNRSNPAVMLRCGHLCCTQCETYILSGIDTCPLNAGDECEKHEKKHKTPADLGVLRSLPDPSDVLVCGRCPNPLNLHSSDHLYASGRTTCVYCGTAGAGSQPRRMRHNFARSRSPEPDYPEPDSCTDDSECDSSMTQFDSKLSQPCSPETSISSTD